MTRIALDIRADHPAYAGHFPGQPLLPGVVLVAEVLEAMLDDPAHAARLGPTPRLAAVKFLAPVRPGVALMLHCQPSTRGLAFEVHAAGRVAASGEFEAAT